MTERRAHGPDDPHPVLTRRRFLGLGAGGAAATAGAVAAVRLGAGPASVAVTPASRAVAVTEAARDTTGRTVRASLRAAPSRIDLGAGQVVDTWAYHGQVPGPEIRLTRGDTLEVALQNDLAEQTAVHWHGLAIRNDMDGVPGVTAPSVAAGGGFAYRFVVPDSGTYWYHSHSGLQLDRGLYGPLLVDEPGEPVSADVDVTLMLDDWLDGTGRTPDEVLEDLRRRGMAMSGMSGTMGTAAASGAGPLPSALGADTGDVDYPTYLINGRSNNDPRTVRVAPSQRVRLRLVNAGADTAFRFAVGGHRLTVTHADGFPVVPVDCDTLLVGMGERYDAILTARDGAFPMVSYAEGKGGTALAVLRSASGAAPSAGALPTELSGRLLSYTDLTPREGTALTGRTPDTVLVARLGMGASGYQWLINGRPYDRHQPLDVVAGQRVRLDLRNETMMFHPMHLHGHTFALLAPTGPGTRKDTVIVPPMRTVSVELDSDNPGQWLLHCHNAYHQAGGMETVLSYRT